MACVLCLAPPRPLCLLFCAFLCFVFTSPLPHLFPLYSDAHYGRVLNLISPGRAKNMGEGWETRRNSLRPPVLEAGAGGHLLLPQSMADWAIIQLAVPGTVQQLRVDTNHFKGNFPESCTLDACYAPDLAADVDRATAAFADGAGAAAQVTWFPLLPRVKLAAHAEKDFKIEEGAAGKAITHVRLTIYPDGGISRLRLWGLPL